MTDLVMIITVLFLSSSYRVLASKSELADLESTLQKSLEVMTCEESKSFFQHHIVTQGLGFLPANVSSHLDTLDDKENCSETKRAIHDVVAQALKTNESENAADPKEFLEPIFCSQCNSSLCTNATLCLPCCISGHQPLCFSC